MQLKEFNPGNCGSSGRTGLSPRIRINKKSGLFGFSASGCTLIGLSANDLVAILQDEENPTDWYIEAVQKNGFQLRPNSSKASHGLYFNSCRIAKLIFESAGCSIRKTGTVLIAGKPTLVGDRVLFGLITNTLYEQAN